LLTIYLLSIQLSEGVVPKAVTEFALGVSGRLRQEDIADGGREQL
jgi:hypothetical protein